MKSEGFHPKPGVFRSASDALADADRALAAAANVTEQYLSKPVEALFGATDARKVAGTSSVQSECSKRFSLSFFCLFFRVNVVSVPC